MDQWVRCPEAGHSLRVKVAYVPQQAVILLHSSVYLTIARTAQATYGRIIQGVSRRGLQL
jgi:hypothetical protein